MEKPYKNQWTHFLLTSQSNGCHDLAIGICGKEGQKYGRVRYTDKKSNVTCPRCLKEMERI